MRRLEIVNEGAHLAVRFRSPGNTPNILLVPHAMAGPVGAALMGAAEVGMSPYPEPSASSDRHLPATHALPEEAVRIGEQRRQPNDILAKRELPMADLKPPAIRDLTLPDVPASFAMSADAASLADRATLERRLVDLEAQRAEVDARIEFLRELLAAF